jgi:hypothetical protein
VIGHDLPALLAPEGHGEIDWSHDFEPVTRHTPPVAVTTPPAD